MTDNVQISTKVERTIRYYFQRLLPFVTICVLYEMIDVGFVTLWEDEATTSWVPWMTLVLEMFVSMVFAILPYLLYLMSLPAAFHGGRCDRLVSTCVLALFCLVNGAEELSEILSGSSFHLMTVAFVQKPKDALLTFFDLHSAVPGVLAVLGVVVVSVMFFRKRMMADATLPVPNAASRFIFTCCLMAVAFLLNFSLEGFPSANAEPEVYHDGLFSLFGSLIAFTAVPDLGQVYAPSCMMLVVVVSLACLANAAVVRYVSPTWSPWGLAVRGYSRLAEKYGRWSVNLVIMLLVILGVRLYFSAQYPLMDTTEARYGEMARKMIETGNWLQPQFDYGVPFWGKPPLSFWGSAATMWLLGISEWSARLAPFIASVCTGLLFYAWPFPDKRKSWATAAFIVMMSAVMGFMAAGAVMTDSFLTLGVAMGMVAFRRTMEPQASRIWGYLFFVGLAIGLMSKGPLTLVLCGMPVFFWTCYNRKWKQIWRHIPWLTGTLLMLLLTVPWYWAAEQATPGFLRYFLVGEHFERFVVKGWEGDLYGSGHPRAFGSIWLFALEMFLPWVLLLPFIAFRKHKPEVDGTKEERSFLWIWMLSPLVFFTFARNVLPAYVLPGLPAFSLLLVDRLRAFAATTGRKECRDFIFMTTPVMLLIVMFGIGSGFSYIEYRCHKDLLESWDGKSPLYYFDKKTAYSGVFYSAGKAVVAPCSPEECPVGTCGFVPQNSELLPSFSHGWKQVDSARKWYVFVKVSE